MPVIQLYGDSCGYGIPSRNTHASFFAPEFAPAGNSEIQVATKESATTQSSSTLLTPLYSHRHKEVIVCQCRLELTQGEGRRTNPKVGS